MQLRFEPTVSQLILHGATWDSEPALEDLWPVPGPFVKTTALRAEDDTITGRIALPERMGREGTLAVWVMTDRPCTNGPGADTDELEILSLDGLLSLRLGVTSSCASLQAVWAEDIEGVDPLHVLVPGLPGPQWLHLALAWDAGTGRFDLYINGTCARKPGTQVNPWTPAKTQRLNLVFSRLAIGEMTLRDQALDDAEVRRLTPQLYQGALDNLLGNRPLPPVDLVAEAAESIYTCSFTQADEVAHWVMEGKGITTFSKSGMTMKSSEPEGPEGHHVFWCDQDFPADFVARWEVRMVSTYGLCILFFAATPHTGDDLFGVKVKPRNGVFSQYIHGDIDCYHVSYYANTPFNPGRITANLRKNSGFYLVSNGPAAIPPGDIRWHTVTLRKAGGDIRLAVDDHQVFHFVDNGDTYGPILEGGKIGFRQMQWMEAQYRDFEVFSLKS